MKVAIPFESAVEFQPRDDEDDAEGPGQSPVAAPQVAPVLAAAPMTTVEARATVDTLPPAVDAQAKRSANTAATDDLLGEAAGSKWFVRPPSGGQYGPADAGLFRAWILEGRVTPDCHVWKDGWPDWQLADDLLARFEAAGTKAHPAEDGVWNIKTPGAAAKPLVDDRPTIIPTERPANPAVTYRQRKATRSTAMLIVILFLACAVLFAALLYVLRMR